MLKSIESATETGDQEPAPSPREQLETFLWCQGAVSKEDNPHGQRAPSS